MALTDTAIRKAKAGAAEWKLTDEKGLYLLVTPAGSKLWRLKYRFKSCAPQPPTGPETGFPQRISGHRRLWRYAMAWQINTKRIV